MKLYSDNIDTFDSFELHGKWWLPDAPHDRIHGTLTFFSSQRVELRLDGKFQHPNLDDMLQGPFKTECILGETIEEEFVTVHNAFASRVGKTQTFVADSLFAGTRFNKASDLAISGALVEYTNLDEWASVSLIKTVPGTAPHSFQVVLPTNSQSLLVMQNVPPFMSLELRAAVRTSSRIGSFSAEEHAFFDCVFEKPLTLREVDTILLRLGNLLSVLQGDGTYVKKVRLRIVAPKNGDSVTEWFRPSRLTAPVVVSRHDMNLPLHELSAAVAVNLFAAWFASASLLDSVYDLVVGTYGGQSERTKFRALAQAVEAFHRAVYGGTYTDEEFYQPIRKAICAAIPTNLDADFQQRLESAIKYGYQFSLRTRLKKLLETVSEATKDAVIREKTSTFIGILVAVRNYLTHFDDKEKPSIVDTSGDMYNLNQRLGALMIVLLLTHCGVPEDKATKGIVAHLRLAF